MKMEHLNITHAKLGAIDFASLPAATQRKFVVSGINHVFGNEVSSRVNSFFKKAGVDKALADKASELGRALTDEEKKAIRASVSVTIDTESPEYDETFSSFLNDKWEAAKAGTLGESRVVSRDPFADKVTSIAREEVLAMLRKGGFWTGKKAPGEDETWEMGNATYTFAQLIDRRIAKEKGRIEKEANAFLAAKAKKAKAIEESALEF